MVNVQDILTLTEAAELDAEAIEALAAYDDLPALTTAAASKRDAHHDETITYSRKVFIPLTQLCRDVCHYCTFAQTPRRLGAAYLSRERVLEIARAGKAAGCREALFTLGDKPELRYEAARRELDALGHPTTIAYLVEMARLVFEATGLLPHVNPGVLTRADIDALRRVSVSQGIMLESAAARLCEPGGAHHGSPDKHPEKRLETMRLAGELSVPLTTGLLIGIGETRAERIASLLAIRELHQRFGHIQEVIVQNFRPKPGTKMARTAPPLLHEHLWTIAMARLLFAPDMNIQAPPNLAPGSLPQLVGAGINDWGGVSPVTPDHVNPEAPWPHLQRLARRTQDAGKRLSERLALHAGFAARAERWVDEALRTAVLKAVDGEGLPRDDKWHPGGLHPLPAREVELLAEPPLFAVSGRRDLHAIVEKAQRTRLDEADVVRLFRARDRDFALVCAAADELRRATCGDTVSYVVTRNINYTNICYFKCQFCAFSKGKLSENLRGRPYDISMEEIADRVREAWERGATEVCLQGGIHPRYTGRHYLDVCDAVKRAAPAMHIHAFSPLEIHQGAATLGISVREFLHELKRHGLGTLPGTAAEILDDEVRARLCPDKIGTRQWLAVMREAHALGIRSTSTIMFGHIDRYDHWARHLLRIRDLQAETGGFTEFVPLPFVPTETPIYLKGRARTGPTFREAVLMHAVARLALHPVITNIQASWVKLGPDGVRLALKAGVNDLGGTLMDESISRAAGASHGQEMTPPEMERIIRAAGRTPRQRTTLYGEVCEERRERSLQAPPRQADHMPSRSVS